MINIGLIGCGKWGKNYIYCFDKIRNAKLIWICDNKNAILQGIIPKDILFTNNFKEIIADKRINAVIIATPPETHYKIAKYAIENGKDVLVEKPVTCDSKEAHKLYEISEKNKRILMVGHIFLYNPAVTKIKEIFSDKFFYFYSRRTGRGPVLDNINCMWNLAPHDISIINHITGEIPKRVSAVGFSYLKKGIEDVVNLALEYKNVSGIVHLSWIEPEKIREIDFVGKNQNLIFDDLSSDKLKMIKNNKKEFKIKIKNKEPLAEELQAFINSIISRKKPLSDGYNGYIVTKILECADKSLKNSGKFVDIRI